jgi:hypothetical protein
MMWTSSVHAPPGSRPRVPQRVAVAAATLLLAVAPGTAMAAAPANDLPAGAIALTTLPASIDQDTTEATVTTDDVGCGAGGVDLATVWYTLTLPQDTRVAVDASASDYGVGINVFDGTPSPDTLIDCAEPALVFDATGGTTYYLMFADPDGDNVNGGHLVVSLTEAPPPIDVTATVDPIAKVNSRTGEVLVGGTITCSSETSDAYVSVDLGQALGRFRIHGYGDTGTDCGTTPTQWWVTLTGDNGRFGPGKATANVDAFACDQFSCSDAYLTASLRVRK